MKNPGWQPQWRSTHILITLLVGLISGSAQPLFAVQLQPCDGLADEDRAVCGKISVLEDRSHPDGRRLDLQVMVLRAEQPNGSAPLFLLAGGPGQGATDLAGLAFGPYAAVRKHRDVVMVDQRGTGQSNPLPCMKDVKTNPQAAFGGLFDPEFVAQCREEALEHADPTLYGTTHVVADLEEVREQLGYDKVVLWGGSGGTRTALIWLRTHPENIEAIAIDGVAPPFMLAPSGYARGCQDAIDRVFAECEAQASCRDAYPDLREEFQQLLHLFDEGVVQTSVDRDGEEVPIEMHRGDFGYAVRGILYRADGIAGLPALIHDAATKQDVSAFANRLWQRAVGLGQFVAIGVHLSVFGTEDIPFIDRRRIPELTEGTFLGTYLIDQYLAACQAWQGQGVLPEGYHDPVHSNVPVLLLSGYYDPSTPPVYAEEVSKTLPNSRHIIVRNESHGSGFGCAREAVVQFLQTASLDDLGEVCGDVGPIVFEVP